MCDCFKKKDKKQKLEADDTEMTGKYSVLWQYLVSENFSKAFISLNFADVSRRK